MQIYILTPQHKYLYIVVQLYIKYLHQNAHTCVPDLHTAYTHTHLDVARQKKKLNAYMTYPSTLKYSPRRAYGRRSNQRANDSQTTIPTEAALEERRHSRARQKFPETSTIKRDLQGFRSTSNEFTSTRGRKPSDLCLHALKNKKRGGGE